MTKPRIVPLLAALGILGAAAPAAQAAPPWSTPSTVGPDANAVTRAQIAFGASGHALVAWNRPCGPPECDRPQMRLATGAPGSGWRVFRDLAGAIADDPVAYGSTRALVLRQTSIDRDRRVRLGVSFGRVTGDVDPQRVLDEYADGGGAAIAANSRGDAVVAWIEARPGRDLLWMAERRAGRPFGKRRVIRSGRRMSDVDVAVGEGRDVVVAYRRADRLEARWSRAGGRLEGPQSLGPTDDLTNVEAAVARSGRMVVAWGAQDGGIEANEPYVVRAAVRPAGPRGFRPATTLDPGGAAVRPESGVRVALAPDGTGVVAWAAAERSGQTMTFPVRAAAVDAGARVTPLARELAPSGRLGAVTVTGDGTATAVWTRLGGADGLSPGPVEAAVRAPGEPAFAATEQVSGDFTTGPPSAALDPRTGRPTAVWSQLPTPPDVPNPDPRGTVMVSTRG
jgi:hypothetical protein